MKTTIILAGLALLCAGCPGTGAPDMLRAEAIRPSVQAITTEFDSLVLEAAYRGDMTAVRADAWLGESALLRHAVSEDPSLPVVVPPSLLVPPTPQ